MKFEEILVCSCSDVEHQIVIMYDSDFYKEGEEKEVYATIHMVNGGFWFRLKNAIKYLFGFKCVYGHFDEFIFKKEHLPKLRKVIEALEN